MNKYVVLTKIIGERRRIYADCPKCQSMAVVATTSDKPPCAGFYNCKDCDCAYEWEEVQTGVTSGTTDKELEALNEKNI